MLSLVFLLGGMVIDSWRRRIFFFFFAGSGYQFDVKLKHKSSKITKLELRNETEQTNQRWRFGVGECLFIPVGIGYPFPNQSQTSNKKIGIVKKLEGAEIGMGYVVDVAGNTGLGIGSDRTLIHHEVFTCDSWDCVSWELH